MDTLTYKGYAARMEYSEEDQCFVGHIAGIRDVIGFHGESVAELRTAFFDTVDGYLKACEQLGWEPNHPYHGQVCLYLSPRLHARVAMVAKTQGKSLNTWVTEIIERGLVSDSADDSVSVHL